MNSRRHSKTSRQSSPAPQYYSCPRTASHSRSKPTPRSLRPVESSDNRMKTETGTPADSSPSRSTLPNETTRFTTENCSPSFEDWKLGDIYSWVLLTRSKFFATTRILDTGALRRNLIAGKRDGPSSYRNSTTNSSTSRGQRWFNPTLCHGDLITTQEITTMRTCWSYPMHASLETYPSTGR